MRREGEFMDFISRRKSLVILAGTLSGCTTMTANTQVQSNMVVDDGVSEITPVYVMTHTEGQSSTFLRANFYFYDAKKQVELRSGGSIKVNGIELQHDPKTLASYIGSIPLPHGLLTFEFTRSPGHTIKHSFALPELEVMEFPKYYRVGDVLSVSVAHRPARPGVARDVYGLDLRSAGGIYEFVNEPAEATRIGFRPILKNVGFPAGSALANVVRQQRTPLKDLSSELRTGWAVASRARDFTIEVVN